MHVPALRKIAQATLAVIGIVIGLLLVSPPISAQLNRISPAQITCAAGRILAGGTPATCTANPTISGMWGTTQHSGGIAFNGSTTRFLAPDAGAYAIESNQAWQFNAATVSFANAGTNKFSFPSVGTTDGQMQSTNGNGTTGVGIDVTTDSTLLCLTRAFGVGCTIQAATVNATSKFQVNGVDFAVGTPCSNTAASTDITGTNTKTYFSISCKIPANTLAAAGDFIKLGMRGVYSGNATDTLTFTLEACQVQGCGSGTVVVIATAAAITLGAVSNQAWWLDEQIVSFTTGAAGTHDAQGHIFYELTGTTATPDALPNTTTTTWSDTVDEYLTMSVTFSTTSGNDHASIRNIVGTIQ